MASKPKMLMARADEPLIAIPMELDGEEVTCFVVGHQAADAAVASIRRKRPSDLSAASEGLDFDEMMDELDRIRHASPPSPPLNI